VVIGPEGMWESNGLGWGVVRGAEGLGDLREEEGEGEGEAEKGIVIRLAGSFLRLDDGLGTARIVGILLLGGKRALAG
jgi:hypothetical protein